MTLEENLKTIKDAKLDIELLKRQNDILCQENNMRKNLSANLAGAAFG